MVKEMGVEESLKRWVLESMRNQRCYDHTSVGIFRNVHRLKSYRSWLGGRRRRKRPPPTPTVAAELAKKNFN